MDDLQYIKEKYGPFIAKGTISKDDLRCSFCTGVHKQFLKVFSDKKPNIYLYVCLLCSRELLGKQSANKIWFSSFKEVLVKSDVLAFEKAMKDVIKRLTEIDSNYKKNLVEAAIRFRTAGFGMEWKVIPGIIKWYTDKSYLSEKQQKTLKAYVAYCKRKVEE